LPSSLSNAAVVVVMRVAVTVRVRLTTVGPVTAAFPTAFPAVAVFCCHAPEAMAAPGAFLALFGAVFCATAAAAFCKLPCVLFPFAALPVGTLSNAAARVVFPAEVAHDYACPV